MDVDVAGEDAPEDEGSKKPTKIDSTMFMGYTLRKIRGIVNSATIGYMRVDMINPPPGAFWGMFNDHAIRESWIEELLKDYRESMVDNCVEFRAIDLAVKPEWLTIDPYGEKTKLPKTIGGDLITDVPALEFTEEGAEAILPDNLWMLSGNHRRVALRRHLEQLTKEVEELKEECRVLEMEQVKNGFNAEINGRRNVLMKEDIPELETKIAHQRLWAARVIDRGERLGECERGRSADERTQRRSRRRTTKTWSRPCFATCRGTRRSKSTSRPKKRS